MPSIFLLFQHSLFVILLLCVLYSKMAIQIRKSHEIPANLSFRSPNSQVAVERRPYTDGVAHLQSAVIQIDRSCQLPRIWSKSQSKILPWESRVFRGRSSFSRGEPLIKSLDGTSASSDSCMEIVIALALFFLFHLGRSPQQHICKSTQSKLHADLDSLLHPVSRFFNGTPVMGREANSTETLIALSVLSK
jgi:hypothetical protein